MEYSLTFNDIGLYGSVCGLNPYSNGILPDGIWTSPSFLANGLNPYSNGILPDN